MRTTNRNHMPARGQSWPQSRIQRISTLRPGDRVIMWRNHWGVLHPITHETQALVRNEAFEAIVTDVSRVRAPDIGNRYYILVETTEGSTIPLPAKRPALVLTPETAAPALGLAPSVAPIEPVVTSDERSAA